MERYTLTGGVPGNLRVGVGLYMIRKKVIIYYVPIDIFCITLIDFLPIKKYSTLLEFIALIAALLYQAGKRAINSSSQRYKFLQFVE